MGLPVSAEGRLNSSVRDSKHVLKYAISILVSKYTTQLQKEKVRSASLLLAAQPDGFFLFFLFFLRNPRFSSIKHYRNKHLRLLSWF